MKTGAIPLVISIVFLAALMSPHAAEAQPIAGGVLRGQIWGYTWFDNPTPLIWANVSAYIDGRLVGYVSTGSKGSYLMYLPEGRVNVTVEYPGFIRQSRIVYVSNGGVTTLDWYLERSGLPIPEFSQYSILILVAAMLGSIQLLMRRRAKRA